ncbi:MAG: hypothetical protein ACJ79H_16450 [Myxococcales bacterium]
MRRFAFAAVAVAAACAHDARPEPKTKLVPAQLVSCAVEAPSATSGGAPVPDMSADFQVDPHGKVREIHIQGGGAQAKALRRHLESCQYEPATRDGRPIASRRAAVYGGYR